MCRAPRGEKAEAGAGCRICHITSEGTSSLSCRDQRDQAYLQAGAAAGEEARRKELRNERDVCMCVVFG